MNYNADSFNTDYPLIPSIKLGFQTVRTYLAYLPARVRLCFTEKTVHLHSIWVGTFFVKSGVIKMTPPVDYHDK